jgi:hypothetical protein
MAMKGIKLKGNKGITVWDMSNVAFTIVFIGVALAIGMWTNEEMVMTAYPAMNMNDSINFAANDTYYKLTHRAKNVNYIQNTTVSYTIGAENWTTRVDGYNTWVKAYFDDDVQAGTYNVNYNGLNSSAHYITSNATEGMSDLSQWLPIIMVVLAAAIVIAALAMWFGKR